MLLLKTSSFLKYSSQTFIVQKPMNVVRIGTILQSTVTQRHILLLKVPLGIQMESLEQ